MKIKENWDVNGNNLTIVQFTNNLIFALNNKQFNESINYKCVLINSILELFLGYSWHLPNQKKINRKKNEKNLNRTVND